MRQRVFPGEYLRYGQPTVTPLARPHSTAAECFGLIGAGAASGYLMSYGSRGYFLAAAYDRVTGRRLRLR